MPSVTLEGLGQDGGWRPKLNGVGRRYQYRLPFFGKPHVPGRPKGIPGVARRRPRVEGAEAWKKKLDEFRLRGLEAYFRNDKREMMKIADKLSVYAVLGPTHNVRKDASEAAAKIRRTAEFVESEQRR